jgi:hypothetical protein
MKKTIFIYALILSSITLNAAHLVGGYLSYEYLGNDDYKFTYRVYRDCSSFGAPFDAIIYFGIYNDTVMIKSERVSGYKISSIIPPILNCKTSKLNVCMEEAIYEFTTKLAKIINTYTISTQRCCRKANIDNLLNSGISGSTFMIQIQPNNQGIKNSSPTFNYFPPSIVCMENLVVDFSANDIDKDSLVYEFCAPFVGGSSGSSSSCSSTVPIPPCPPAYLNVTYKTPSFSFTKPLEANPALVLNPKSGILTGKPTEIGVYIIGICVKEYRNGSLINNIIRDVLFTVVDDYPVSVSSLYSNNSFEIAPNPATHSLLIKHKSFFNKISIKDISGRILNQIWTPNSTNEYDVSNLKSGIYFITITDIDNHILINKFVKE